MDTDKIKYAVVVEESAESLSMEVEYKLRNGWQLYGNMVMRGSSDLACFCQPMVNPGSYKMPEELLDVLAKQDVSH